MLLNEMLLSKSSCLFQDLIEMTLRKMDVDKDGRVSLQDWKATIRAEPLLLEAFGPCLPNKKASEVFIDKSRGTD
jgi:hypothetical protein